MKELEQLSISEFQEKLLYWFERNMRDLPWRKNKNPYYIWISEIMLQQTKVDTVIPYFNRFIQRFPTIDALADAPEDEVLKHWEGLGYYSRARNLQSAVKEVREAYGGQVPDTKEELSKLKGVGSYTTGAVLSIAYGKPEPAVDGNVMRVFSRILAIHDDIQKQKTKRLFEDIVRKLIPVENTSYFNQGVMELGALICTPKSPKCHICPVADHCQAHVLGIEQQLPVKQKKQKVKYVPMVAGVLTQNGKVLIRQRVQESLLAKLYEFPNLAWEESPTNCISQHYHELYDIQAITSEQWEQVQHTFSHLIWDITVYLMHILTPQEEEKKLPQHSYWVRIEELDTFAFSVSHQKIKKMLMNNYQSKKWI